MIFLFARATIVASYWKATPLPAHANFGRQKSELAKKNLDRQPRGQKATSPAPIPAVGTIVADPL